MLHIKIIPIGLLVNWIVINVGLTFQPSIWAYNNLYVSIKQTALMDVFLNKLKLPSLKKFFQNTINSF